MFNLNRERRYNAAVAIHLAAYTFSMMAPNERAKVDDKVYADMNGAVVGFSPFEFQRLWPPYVKAAWRAYAMSDLGISPAIAGDVWRLPKSRRLLWGSPKTGPTKLFTAYRPNDEATMRARSDLEVKGLDARYLELSAS
ncbi:MAG: hypothetical protein ABJC66_17425 [Gammaproteobacteria bacterium]